MTSATRFSGRETVSACGAAGVSPASVRARSIEAVPASMVLKSLMKSSILLTVGVRLLRAAGLLPAWTGLKFRCRFFTHPGPSDKSRPLTPYTAESGVCQGECAGAAWLAGERPCIQGLRALKRTWPKACCRQDLHRADLPPSAPLGKRRDVPSQRRKVKS